MAASNRERDLAEVLVLAHAVEGIAHLMEGEVAVRRHGQVAGLQRGPKGGGVT